MTVGKEHSIMDLLLIQLPSVCTDTPTHHTKCVILIIPLQAIRKLIRAKYSELQQNKEFVENKRRFQELHDKLDHIKRQVMEYDQTRGATL